MRSGLFSLSSLSIPWIAIAVTLCLSSGCQKWSLRQNVNAFFGGEAKDDWEPPLKTPVDPLAKEESADAATNRSWWSKRSMKGTQRVILPRDRKSAESKPSHQSSADAPPLPRVSAPLPSALAPNANLAKGELVAFGSNPNGAAGKILQTPSNDPSRDEKKPNVMDTGVQDVDLAASLNTLPPPYRDIVLRTLEAVKEGKPIDTTTDPATPVASAPAAPLPPPATPGVSVRLSEATMAAASTSNPPTSNPPTSKESASNPAADVAVAVADPQNQANVIQTAASVPANNTPAPSAPPAALIPPPPLVASASPTSTLLAAPSPTAQTKSATWHAMVSDAVERLESELESKPTADESLRRSQELTLRMLYVAQRRLDDALRPIDRMDPSEQEYVRHQMQALYEASNPDANPSRARHWSTVMMSQREATSHLAAVSNLEVRSVAFCTQVDGYGTYQKFPKNQFAPDQDVLLYCEIDNVAAAQVKGGYETQLQGNYEIRDAQGRLVADQELPMEPEICTNHRRDYFMVYRIYIPSQLGPGTYELRLTVQDKKGGKYGHSSASFDVRK